MRAPWMKRKNVGPMFYFTMVKQYLMTNEETY